MLVQMTPAPPNTKQSKTRQVRVLLHLGLGHFCRQHHHPRQKQACPQQGPQDHQADRLFIKHGYAPSPETIDYLKSLKVDRVLVCGLVGDST